MVQKHSQTFGTDNEGNLITLKELEKKLKKEKNQNFEIEGFFLPEIEKLITVTMESVSQRLNPKNRENCFQIFGYDIMFDENFKGWVIECNMNPSFKPANKTQQKMLPRMLGKIFW